MPETTTPQPESNANMSHKAVTRSTWRVSALTMSSRLLGLVRDYWLIAIFAVNPWVTDAFVLAFTLPNLFRRLFGEGALSAAFIPAFVKSRETDGAESSSRLASIMLSILVVLTGVLALVGIGACLCLDAFLGANDEVHLALQLAAVMLPFLCLICTSALLSGMLQSIRVFSVPAAMSILLNLCFLGSFAWIEYVSTETAPDRTIFFVAYAVVGAGLLQVFFQWPILAAKGISLTPNFSFGDTCVQGVLKAMGPTALGLGVVQVNVLIDNLIAYLYVNNNNVVKGANTYLYLGNRLMQLPLGVFGIAIATTVFPILASHAALKEEKPMVERIARAIRMLLFIILPAAVGLGVMSAPLVQMIFQKPDLAFSDLAVYRTAAVLTCYAAGLGFFSVQHLLTRSFYAIKDYKTPVRLAMWMVGVNLLLNLLLIRAPDLYRRWMGAAFTLKWDLVAENFPMGEALGEAGLALATSITAGINVLILWALLKKKLQPKVGEEFWEKTMGSLIWSGARIFAAAAAMGVFVYFSINSIPYEPELWARIQRGIAPVLLGIAGYYIACMVIPVPEFEEFIKIRKGKAPEESEDPKGLEKD